jgi:hypothetical protein
LLGRAAHKVHGMHDASGHLHRWRSVLYLVSAHEPSTLAEIPENNQLTEALFTVSGRHG